MTIGDNRVSYQTHKNVGYSAGTGWDACSGLGSPNGAVLAAQLTVSKPAPAVRKKPLVSPGRGPTHARDTPKAHGAPMTRWLQRLGAMTLGAVAVGAVSTACSHSTTEPRPLEADRFTHSLGRHVRLQRRQHRYSVDHRGRRHCDVLDRSVAQHSCARSMAAGPSTQIRPRLLLDTITINDTISGPPFGANLLRPSYLAFDGNGGLWMSVGGRHDSGSVVEYLRSQISQNGRLTPMVTLPAARTTGLTFDAKGALWVADSAATALLEYSGIQLMTSAHRQTRFSERDHRGWRQVGASGSRRRPTGRRVGVRRAARSSGGHRR